MAMVVSEMEPFAKTGGLADVAGSLPAALGRLGLEIHVFLPRYDCVKEKRASIPLEKRVTVHFVDHGKYFKRRGLYGGTDGDYPDNLDRFSFFCRQALVAMRADGISPDILHAHDWQSALSVVYLSTQFKQEPAFSRTRSVFTIHNLGYQGLFPKEQYPKLGLPSDLFGIEGFEFYGKVNLLKGGLVFAQAITTVSPTYAREIQTQEQGAGLDGVLRKRANDLVGILNGIDQKAWDPAADKTLPHRYDGKRLKAKGKNKAALQKEMDLPGSPKLFLIGMVTRLASQKGLDLVIQALPKLEQMGIQLVILGSGDRLIEQAVRRAAKKSSAIRVRLAFDPDLARRIYAGVDAFLMPSRYEPCGLGQMIAMRYGTVPIVRATGGLTDTVPDTGVSKSAGRGFCFGPANSKALVEAVRRALGVYRDPPAWEALQRRCMGTDFSWARSAKEYIRLYERLVGKTPA